MNKVISVTLESLYDLVWAERDRRWALHTLTGLAPSHFKPAPIDGLPNLDWTVEAVIAGQPAQFTGYVGFGTTKIREWRLDMPDWVTSQQRAAWLVDCGVQLRDMALARLGDEDELIEADMRAYRASLEHELA